jgi:uncharacterized protein with PhoU and TrkA domain
MLPPEAVQVIVDLALTAMLLGSMVGFICSRMLEKLLDLVLYRIQRRERIEAARTRDHSLVPPIK